MFSWQTTVETISLRLSHPSSPSAQYNAELNPEYKTGTSDPESPPERPPDIYNDGLQRAFGGEASNSDSGEIMGVYVLDVVISDTNIGMGFRASGQGSALEGSFHSIYASALNGSKIFSISPTSLWGVAESECNEGSSGLRSPEGEIG